MSKKIREEKSYFSTAIEEFGFTKNQLENAIKKKIITVEFVKNPHYRSGAPARLLSRAELKEKASLIKAEEKTSEREKTKRKWYAQRSRAKDKLEFYCEQCYEVIRALPNSEAFEGFFSGDLSKEQAMEFLEKAHNRHVHTDYDERRQELYEKNKNMGLSWEEAHAEARAQARKELKFLRIPTYVRAAKEEKNENKV